MGWGGETWLPSITAATMCIIKSFRGEGVVDGEGGSSEGCLKWGGGGRGSLRDLCKNIQKQEVGKGNSCSKGGGGLKVSPPLPPPGKF